MAEEGEEPSRSQVQRRFTTHTLRKTPTAGHGHALAWGWAHKRGAGGLLHRANYKKRFFVLFRVPQGHVLVYYERKSVSMDDLLGFIDLRKAVKLEEDIAKIGGRDTRVIKIVTKERTFFVAPCTINSEVLHPAVEMVQFILGWPVPEPAFGHELDAEAGDDIDDIFERWQEAIGSAIETEKEVVTYDAEIVADSTETLPDRIQLRIAPTNLVCLDAEDESVALTCTAYDQIKSWKAPIPTELHIVLTAAATGSVEGRVVFGLADSVRAKEEMESHVRRIISHVKPPHEGLSSSGGADSKAGDDDSDDDLGPPSHPPPDLGPPSRPPPDSSKPAAEAKEAPVEAKDEAPAPAPAAAASAPAASNPYEGWATYTDKASGRTYYANKATGQTSWTWPPKLD